MNVPVLPADTGVGASPGDDTISEGNSALATILWSKTAGWPVANYKSRYANFFDAHQFITVFSDGRNAFVFNRRGVKRETGIGCWNCRRQVLQTFRLRYMDLVGPLDVPMVRHEDGNSYEFFLVILLERAGSVWGIMGLKACS